MIEIPREWNVILLFRQRFNMFHDWTFNFSCQKFYPSFMIERFFKFLKRKHFYLSFSKEDMLLFITARRKKGGTFLFFPHKIVTTYVFLIQIKMVDRARSLCVDSDFRETRWTRIMNSRATRSPSERGLGNFSERDNTSTYFSRGERIELRIRVSRLV